MGRADRGGSGDLATLLAADTVPLLAAHGVGLRYTDGDRVSDAVADVTLDMPSLGFLAVMGPSGSGKSSLLYLLSGLKRPTSGEITCAGTQYGATSAAALATLRRERFGFVFQQPFLLNYLTARENVLAAADARDGEAGAHADELLDRLGVGRFTDRYPHELSGGERQRICVARAMVNRPAVIFADEPTAALDHANGHAVIDLLASYRSVGLVLIVTHDPEMAAEADHVYHMRDGRVTADMIV
jgi:putative ABC transport system ATP-binding protein